MKKILEKINYIGTQILNLFKKISNYIRTFLKTYYENSKLQKFAHFIKLDKLVIFLKQIQLLKRIILLVIIPTIIYLYTQYFCNGKIFFEHPRMKFNLILIYLIITIIYCIVGKIKISLLLSMLLTFCIGIINHFITAFRGTPLVPWDIFSVNVAFRVLPTFKFTLTKNLLYGIILFILGIFILRKIKLTSFKNNKLKIVIRIMAFFAILNFFYNFYTTDVIGKYELDENWDPKEEYHNNGLMASLFKQSKNLVINQPDGYDINSLLELSQSITPSSVDNADEEKNDFPNIIAIMNESWADLSVVGNYTYSQDSLHYVKSLSKNTIKGYLHVSVFGATTPNTEWEFLTSNSMAFVPKRTVPYQQYVLRNSYSLATILKSLGYNTSAIHSYYPQGYNRNLAYPRLGFNTFYHINTLHNLDYIREYPSDLSTYKNIIEIYETKKPEEKIFNFTLTMQNHGSYTDETFPNTIIAENNMYPKLNQYLSLVKLSDDALKYLIEYFEKQEEHTIIVIFGDHQPYLEDEFYDQLLSKKYADTTSIEATERKYITPYLIWANYDIDESVHKTPEISVNYLASLLLDVANIEKTPYLTFLDDLRKEIPIITGNGYVDKNNIYHNFDEENEYTKLINNYHYLQFNNMFDNSSKLIDMFELPRKEENTIVDDTQDSQPELIEDANMTEEKTSQSN